MVAYSVIVVAVIGLACGSESCPFDSLEADYYGKCSSCNGNYFLWPNDDTL
jgi:hypothetical protein